MGLRFRVISIIMMFGVLLLVGQYIFSNIFFMNNIILQEENSVKLEADRVEYLLNQYILNLETSVRDWAQWDDTLDFINTLDNSYVNTNLPSTTMENLKINAVIFFDKNEKLKYSIGYNSDSKRITELSGSLRTYLEKNSALICNHKDFKSTLSGIIRLDGGTMLIASAPITDSFHKTPLSGTLLFGRYIDDDIISSIEKITNSKIQIMDINILKEPEYTGIFTEEILDKLVRSKDSYVIPSDQKTVAGYSVLSDFNNDSQLLLKLSMNRTIYTHGKKALHFFTLITLGIGAIITLICIILLQINIVNPILKLSNGIKNLDLNNISFTKLILKGRDEISNLANEINKMLAKIATANEELSSNKKQLELVLEGANLGFWDLNIPDKTIYFGQKIEQIIGYVPKDILIDSPEFEKLIHKDDLELVRKEYYKVIHTKWELENLEFRILNNTGEYMWIAIKGSIVENDEHNNPIRMAGIVSNIDEKKKVEKELQYLSYFDKLTGLYNRGYFEYLLDKRILHKDTFSIVIGDINGLKMTNDTFGHTVGDDIITAVAEVFKKSCRENDIISRWGGDEFAVILDNADDKVADDICNLIKAECLKVTISPITLSIAMGYSTINDSHQNIQDVIKEAEERMNRNKFFESKSARNSIISSLRKSLAEKSHETEEHTSRIYDRCVKIGKKLKMSNAKIDELVLLAFLHDIGKIAIPDYILNKPGKLNEEEWEIMKTHTEIGYRIANATQELNHIAYAILTHHERFDGLGYPKGLKSEEIPIISRIVSIVDSFDVMTHDRPYKTAMSEQEGIDELKRCSGTQFDPEIVEVFIKVLKEKNFSLSSC